MNGCSMRPSSKLTATAVISAIWLGSAMAPASAFQIAGTGGEESSRQPRSAYAEDGQAEGPGQTSVLSPSEIRHVQWCAAQYKLSYDAVNDVYTGKGGVRSKCLSST
jgi:hypothetical protein